MLALYLVALLLPGTASWKQHLEKIDLPVGKYLEVSIEDFPDKTGTIDLQMLDRNTNQIFVMGLDPTQKIVSLNQTKKIPDMLGTFNIYNLKDSFRVIITIGLREPICNPMCKSWRGMEMVSVAKNPAFGQDGVYFWAFGDFEQLKAQVKTDE